MAALNLVPLLSKLVKPTGKILFKVGSRALEVSEPILKVFCEQGCFVAGTLIATEDGPRAIESILSQERVWAFDFEANKWSLQPVVLPIKRYFTGKFAKIIVDGEAVTCTGTHPFWVAKGQSLFDRPVPGDIPENESLWRQGLDGGRWVAAQDLLVGDLLRLRSGREATIEAYSTWIDSAEVFNIWVDKLHSFAAGNKEVLVHNNAAACVKFIEHISTLIKAPAGLWKMVGTTRGRLVEDLLKPLYKKGGFFVMDDLTKAKNFELYDVQKGVKIVSIKTADTSVLGWAGALKDHIRDLGGNGQYVLRNPGNSFLHLVVPVGDKVTALQALSATAKSNGVRLVVTEL